MNICRLNHIGINVKDFDASIAFYRDVLNLAVQKSVKTEDCTITYLLLPNGERIELFDYYSANERCEIHDNTVGYRHIAIEVDDVDEWEKHLHANGAPIVYGPADLPDLGVRVLLFADPNGIVLEFCKPI